MCLTIFGNQNQKKMNRNSIPSKMTRVGLGFAFCNQQIEKVAPGTLQNQEHGLKQNKINESYWKFNPCKMKNPAPLFWWHFYLVSLAKWETCQIVPARATPQIHHGQLLRFARVECYSCKNIQRSTSQIFAFCKEPNPCFTQWETAVYFCQPSKIKPKQVLHFVRLNAVHSRQPSKRFKSSKIFKNPFRELLHFARLNAVHSSQPCKMQNLRQNEDHGPKIPRLAKA